MEYWKAIIFFKLFTFYISGKVLNFFIFLTDTQHRPPGYQFLPLRPFHAIPPPPTAAPHAMYL
jgi:hypothetical protein